MRAANTACTVAGTRCDLEWARKTILAALAEQNFCFNQSPDTFLQEKRITFGALDQKLLQRLQACVVSQYRLEQFLGTLRRQVDRSAAGYSTSYYPNYAGIPAGS